MYIIFYAKDKNTIFTVIRFDLNTSYYGNKCLHKWIRPQAMSM